MITQNNTSTHSAGRLVLVLLFVLGLITLFSFVGQHISAQTQRQQPKQYQPPSQQVSEPAPQGVVVSPGEDYLIGPSDVIEVLIEDAPELSRVLRVSADGTILAPFLGSISAQRKTPNELAKLIADRLRGEYLEDPQVTVTVKQINSRTYFVQGAVRHAGLYQVEGQPSLLKLITIAGGLNENYGSTAFIIREIAEKSPVAGALENAASSDGKDASSAADSAAPNAPRSAMPSRTAQSTKPEGATGAGYELIKVNINGLLRGNFDQNIVIVPGDIVHIPPTDVFFVAGEVNAPGSFVLKDGTTLRQAISLAQGTSFTAAGERGIIFREDPSTGKRSELKVDIPSVMNGKKEDIQIIANDIVIVPNSRMKSIGGTLLRAFGVNSARIPLRYGY